MPERNRHGAVTAVLIVFIVFAALSLLFNLSLGSTIEESYPDAPTWAPFMLVLLNILMIVCLVAVFRWKRWGFYVYVGVVVATFFLNLAIGLSLGSALFGFVGLAILYGVLQIGGQNSAWSQLD